MADVGGAYSFVSDAGHSGTMVDYSVSYYMEVWLVGVGRAGPGVGWCCVLSKKTHATTHARLLDMATPTWMLTMFGRAGHPLKKDRPSTAAAPAVCRLFF